MSLFVEKMPFIEPDDNRCMNFFIHIKSIFRNKLFPTTPLSPQEIPFRTRTFQKTPNSSMGKPLSTISFPPTKVLQQCVVEFASDIGMVYNLTVFAKFLYLSDFQIYSFHWRVKTVEAYNFIILRKLNLFTLPPLFKKSDVSMGSYFHSEIIEIFWRFPSLVGYPDSILW